ncbi:MAG: exosortase system-associated protein, TIGR04073 family [Candidatus Omnitrophica bacterium]|nr:exosortase system-associated protein, TIGR04073 family [Candidatus Omnitrophota bacterium]
MNKTASRWVVSAVIGSLMLSAVQAGWPVQAEASMGNGPIQKLGRGAANLTTGWMELFLQVFKTTEKSGSLAGMSVGLGRGVVLGLGRTLVGAIEVVTFPVPNPTVGYGPVIEPEFITFRDADRW